MSQRSGSGKKKPATFAGRIHIKGGDMEETSAVYGRCVNMANFFC
jgi:hypothetical protein